MKVDQFGCVFNSYENASWVHNHLEDYAIAIPLKLGNSTKLFITFVPLWHAIPRSCLRSYTDGSDFGVQINIHGYKSFSCPFNSKAIISQNFLIEHVGLQSADAWGLGEFLSTVVSGDNCFLKKNAEIN